MTDTGLDGTPPEGRAGAASPAFCAFFIVEGRTLEVQALLLADSLRQHRPEGLFCFAYVPAGYLPDLSALVRRLLEDRGVDIRALHVPQRQWRRPYPQGNKLLAAPEPREADYSILFDTDIGCCGPMLPPAAARGGRVFAVPEGVRTWGEDLDRWCRAYDFFGCRVRRSGLISSAGAGRNSCPISTLVTSPSRNATPRPGRGSAGSGWRRQLLSTSGRR